MTQWLDASLSPCDSGGMLDKSEIGNQESEGLAQGGMTNSQWPMSKEISITNVQSALSNLRQVLECVREAPLLSAPACRYIRNRIARSKAVSPLRFATALHDPGARIGGVGIITACNGL
jgi:hypothetical protein